MSDGQRLSFNILKNCVYVCVGGKNLCACVGGGRGGYQVFFITLHRIPLSQGLSPNPDPGWHPSVSKGPPVLSHYHGVGKEPHPTLYLDAGDLNPDPQACTAMFLATEPSLQSRLGYQQRGFNFLELPLNRERPEKPKQRLRNYRTKTLLGFLLPCFVRLVPSGMLHCRFQHHL